MFGHARGNFALSDHLLVNVSQLSEIHIALRVIQATHFYLFTFILIYFSYQYLYF